MVMTAQHAYSKREFSLKTMDNSTPIYARSAVICKAPFNLMLMRSAPRD